MIMEMDQAIVDSADLAKAKAGDKEAKARIRSKLHGVVLYMHNLNWGDDDVAVITLRELEELDIVKSVKLDCEQS